MTTPPNADLKSPQTLDALPSGVAPETLVRTPQGLVLATDLPSTRRASAAGSGVVPPEVPVAVSGRPSTGRGVRILTKRGLSITVATGQGLLCIDEAGDLVFRRAADLRPGDHVAVDLGRTYQSRAGLPRVPLKPASRKGVLVLRLPGVLTVEMARLWGLYMANGCIVNRAFAVAGHEQDRDVLESLAESLRSLGLNAKPAKAKGQRCVYVQLSSLEFSTWMTENGCRKKVGDGAYSAFIPKAVLESPREVVAAFLAGYFAGDGSVGPAFSGAWVTACTISPRLARELAVLLHHFGICVVVRRRKPQKESWRPYYCVAVSTLQGHHLFAERIGIASQRKMQQLRALKPSGSAWSSRGRNVHHAALLRDLRQHAHGLPAATRTLLRAYLCKGVFNLDWLYRLVHAYPELRSSKAARLLIPGLTYEAIASIDSVEAQDWIALDSAEPVFGDAFVLSARP